MLFYLCGIIAELTYSYCENHECYAAYELADVEALQSVDLRENGLSTSAKDEGICKCTWAFVYAAIVENALLRDTQLQMVGTPWSNYNSITLDLSEQYFAETDYADDFCTGGSPHVAAVWQRNRGLGPQFEAHYKYTGLEGDYRAKKELGATPSSGATPAYYPFKDFPNKVRPEDELTVPNLVIFKYNPLKLTPAESSDIERVKMQLTRGFVVAARLRRSSSFQTYSGGGKVLHSDCLYDSPLTDMDVLIVGYGVKQNKSVWLVKVSWGSSYGDNGHVFIEMGRNSFCMEMEFQTYVSKYYNNIAVLLPSKLTRTKDWQLDTDITCPAGYKPVGPECVKCALTYNGACCNACPQGTHEVDAKCVPCKLTYQSDCVDACPEGTQINGSICSDCPLSYGGVCVQGCPTGTLAVQKTCHECNFTLNNACVYYCPVNFVAKDKVCVLCQYDTSGLCIPCTKIFQGDCVDSCPSKTELNGTICQQITQKPPLEPGTVQSIGIACGVVGFVVISVGIAWAIIGSNASKTRRQLLKREMEKANAAREIVLMENKGSDLAKVLLQPAEVVQPRPQEGKGNKKGKGEDAKAAADPPKQPEAPAAEPPPEAKSTSKKPPAKKKPAK